MNNVTLQDVAQAAGVSLATVSRALHGGYVSAEKRRRIEEAVHTLRYIPNQSAAALKRNRSRTIGHLMHFHDNLLASRVNAGLAGLPMKGDIPFFRSPPMAAARTPGEWRRS